MTNFDFAHGRALTRRQFLQRAGFSIGSMALGGLLSRDAFGATKSPLAEKPSMTGRRAKSIIYLHMSGAPPSLDMFDYKPKLNELNMQPCPESLIAGQK